MAELTTASIFGTAKATQEADNVLILQSSPNGAKTLQVHIYMVTVSDCSLTLVAELLHSLPVAAGNQEQV